MVELGSPQNATVAADRRRGSVTIADDDDPPELRIGDAEGAEDSGELEFAIELDGPSGRDIEVTYATANATADSDQDYARAVARELLVPAGSLAASITVAVHDDTVDEAARETFTIDLAGDPDVVDLVDGQGRGTIIDDDRTVLSVHGGSAVEGAGELRFPVLLSTANSRTVRVDWWTVAGNSDTATPGTDFEPVTGATLSIPAGATSAALVVKLTDDALDEADETFSVMLDRHASVNAIVDPGGDTATGTIADDDGRPGAAWTVAFQRNGADVDTVAEGQGGDQTLDLIVSTGNGVTFPDGRTIVLTADAVSTATASRDYAFGTSPLILPAGETAVSATVTVVDDEFAEDEEALVVNVAVEGPGDIASARLAITDSDTVLSRVTGLKLNGVAGGIEVSWDRVSRADGYRVQWKSGTELFDDAAAQGREAEVAHGGTSHTIAGLSAHETYTVRVIAGGAGYAEGAPSAEVDASPVPSTPSLVRYLRRAPIGMPTTDTLVSVRGAFLMGFRFEGIDRPTGVARDDIEVTGGAVETFHMAQDGSAQVYYATVLVLDGATHVTFRIRQNAIEEGNAAAQVTYMTAAPLTVEFESDAVAPLRGNLELFANFSEPVQQRDHGVPGGGSGFFAPAHDLEIVNGAYVSAQQESGSRYRIVIRPDADLEGVLEVSLPVDTVAAAADTNNRNQEASFTIEVDTEVDDATLSSLEVTAGDAPPRQLALSPAFDPAVTGYEAEATYLDTVASVAATARDREAGVDIEPEDASGADLGHQVGLSYGANEVVVTVTAENGTTMQAYVVDIVRPELVPEITLAGVPQSLAEGGSAQYTVVLATRPSAAVTVNVTALGDGDVTVSPQSLEFDATPGSWDGARTLTVSAAVDADAVDDEATVTHTGTGGGYDAAPVRTFTVRVDDPTTLAQVDGVIVEGVHAGLEVLWTEVESADSYKVQWRSGMQSFSDAAAGGREAVVAGDATGYTIGGLTALETYTVRVIATNAGHGDGPASMEQSASPARAQVRMERLRSIGTVIGDDTQPVRALFWMRFWFPGVDDPIGVTVDDVEVVGASIDEFEVIPRGALQVYYVRMDVDDGVEEVTFRVKENALEGGGNASTAITYPVADALSIAFETAAVVPLRGRFVLFLNFSEAVRVVLGEGDSSLGFDPEETGDLTTTNGTLVSYRKVSATRYRLDIEPRADFEGRLRVTIPPEVTTSQADIDNFNAAAQFEIEVDTLTDDATLASLEVATPGRSGGSPVVLELDQRFRPALTSYATQVPYATQSVTVTAVARDAAGTVAFSPADSDTTTLEHEVALSVGANTIEVTVTAEDGNTTKTYAVNVQRAELVRDVILSRTMLALREQQTGVYEARLASGPTGTVTLTASVTGDPGVTTTPGLLTFTAANWEVPQSITVRAVGDPDSADVTATIEHSVGGGGYDGAVVGSIPVTVADDTPPAQVSGVMLNGVVTGLNVSWDVVLDADGYRIQWRSGTQTFADAAVDGREALLDASATSYEIRGLTALEVYSVQVIATNTGFADGPPSAPTQASPHEAPTVLVRRHADGTPIANQTSSVGESFLVSFRFEGVSDPTGAAEDDIAVSGGTVAAFRSARENGAEVFFADVDVTPGAEEVTLRIWSNAIDEGSTEAEATYEVEPLLVAWNGGAAPPLRGDLELFAEFSQGVEFAAGGQGGSPRFAPAHDLEIVNGTYVSAQQESGSRYRIVIRPDADLEGVLEVSLPVDTVAAAADTNNRNQEASFTIEVDTEVDDATLSSLEVTAGDAPPRQLALSPAFDPAVTGYEAEATYLDTVATVAATARDRETGVDIEPEDASGADLGHQVGLSYGANEVVVTVTAENGTTMQAYVVDIVRPEPVPEITLAGVPQSLAEGGSAQYTVVLATRPSAAVTVNVTALGDGDVTVSPQSLEFDATPGSWDGARTLTVSAAVDADAVDDEATVTHTGTGGGYDAAPVRTFTVRVDDPTTLAQVDGVIVEGVHAGLEVLWTEVESADSYKVQWRSGMQSFSDAAAGGREAVVAGDATGYTIGGLTALETYTVRVIATNAGHGDGPASMEQSASPARAQVRMERLRSIGTVIGDDTQPVRALFWMRFWFPGVDDPIGVTVDDVEVVGASIDEFEVIPRGALQVYYVRMDVDDGVEEVTFRVKENALEGGGNASTAITYPVTDALSIAFETAAVTPLRGRFVLFLNFSEAVRVVLGEGDSSLGFDPEETSDLTTTNGTLVSYRKVSATRYRLDIEPRADFEGRLRVTIPPEVTTSQADIDNLNAAAQFEIEVDTLTDDATLASLEVAAPGRSGGSPVVLELDQRFRPALTSYATQVPYATQSVTVTAVARDAAGTVAFSPADSDTTTLEHEVALSVGANTIEVTVTAEDGNTTKTYAVNVQRAEPVREISLSAASLTLSEGGIGSYTVHLNSLPTGPVTVAVGGAADTDVSVSRSSLTFTAADWATAQTISVTSQQDADGSDDLATLRHTATGADYGGVDVAELAVTVEDDDDPGLVISEQALNLRERSTPASYTVKLATRPVGGSVAVAISGASGTVLSLSTDELLFTESDWEAYQTIVVEAVADADAIDEEVLLKHSAGGADYDSAPVVELKASVEDDDEQRIEVSATDLTIDEEGEPVGYSVALATMPSGPVTVAVGGSAGTDLTLSQTSLTFTPTSWEARQSVLVSATHDADRANDRITLTHAASGADYDSAAQAELPVTVLDNDDTVPDPPIDLTATAIGQSRIDLSWTAPVDDGGHPVSGYRIEVSADGITWTDLVADTAGTDTTYQHTALSANATRHYRVSAVNLQGASSASNEADATTALPVVNITESLQVPEGAGIAQLQVFLDYRSAREVTATYDSRDGTATTGEDYTALSGTLTFLPGEIRKTLDLAIVDDDLFEDAEQGFVAISEYVGAAAGVTWSTLTIEDDDPSNDSTLSILELVDGDDNAIDLTPEFDAVTTTYTASVANAVDAVTLSASANHAGATVAITGDDDTSTPGEAELDLDEGANELTVTVTAEDGRTTQTYTVTVARALSALPQVTGVSLTPGPGQLTVGWSAVTGADGYKVQWRSGTETFADASTDSREVVVTSGATTTYTLTGLTSGIEYTVRVIATKAGAADGPPSEEMKATPTLSELTIEDASAQEGDGVEFTVTLSHAAAGAVTVEYTTSDGTATSGDYTAAAGETLTLEAGSTSATFTIATTEDTQDEADETFTVTLSGASSNVALGAANTATGTIVDDEASSDATLSALGLADAHGNAIGLMPATFDPGTLAYTASVASGVASVTVTPEVGNGNAAVAYMPSVDSDLMSAGHQVALAVGVNTIEVEVTAEDGNSTQTYTVTVTRALGRVAGVALTPGSGQLKVDWNTVTGADGYKVQWRSGGGDVRRRGGRQPRGGRRVGHDDDPHDHGSGQRDGVHRPGAGDEGGAGGRSGVGGDDGDAGAAGADDRGRVGDGGRRGSRSR